MTSMTALHPVNTADSRLAVMFDLPRRFDVHVVDQTVATLEVLACGRTSISIGASAVEMIDLAGLAALTAVAESIDVQIVEPSVAFHATVRYTDHDLLAACCESSELAEVA